MKTTEPVSPQAEKAWLVGIRRHDDAKDIQSHLDELESLLATLGIETAGSTLVPLKKPSPALLVGSGKAEEIKQLADEAGADLIVFDDDLSPSQQRNWERFAALDVIDRQEVIIAIFAGRAKTKEASLQVELASCQYRLPRLAGAWKHLSRQRGGFYGTKGEGEKQIEIDRRILLKKIAELKDELEEVKKQRITRRRLRESKEIFTCAIAGYTNAGKSTLLNTLTGSDVSTGNRLFDTLDPATRKFTLPGGREIVITDTVGFIRKLPHQLIEAFRSTLEEALESDLVILLLDSSSSEVMSHYRASMEVLNEIGAESRNIVPVFNKSDLCKDQHTIQAMRSEFRDAIFISALSGGNTAALVEEIEKRASLSDRSISIIVPHNRFDILHLIRKNGTVVSENYTEEGAAITAVVPERMVPSLEKFKEKK